MYDPQPRLGRIHAPDPNDQRYLLRSLNPQAATAAADVPYKFHYHGTVLDQGTTSACVGASFWQWLDMGPVRNLKKPSWMELYRAAQKNDEFPGEEPAYYGSTVRAAFKVGKQLGFVKTYGWAYDVETAINHVLTVGPMCFGTVWLTDMFETDKDGFIRLGGNVEGGHAYAVKGASRVRRCPDGSTGAFKIVNSWGTKKFGQNGTAWLSFKDADALIRDQGEACTAWEDKPAAVAL